MRHCGLGRPSSSRPSRRRPDPAAFAAIHFNRLMRQSRARANVARLPSAARMTIRAAEKTAGAHQDHRDATPRSPNRSPGSGRCGRRPCPIGRQITRSMLESLALTQPRSYCGTNWQKKGLGWHHRPIGTLESAGINRLGVANESVLQRRPCQSDGPLRQYGQQPKNRSMETIHRALALPRQWEAWATRSRIAL